MPGPRPKAMATPGPMRATDWMSTPTNPTALGRSPAGVVAGATVVVVVPDSCDMHCLSYRSCPLDYPITSRSQFIAACQLTCCASREGDRDLESQSIGHPVNEIERGTDVNRIQSRPLTHPCHAHHLHILGTELLGCKRQLFQQTQRRPHLLRDWRRAPVHEYRPSEGIAECV